MESAIDKHLMCPRTRTRRIADDYKPPFPAWSARASPAVTEVVMGYFGIQHLEVSRRPRAVEAFASLVAHFDSADGPGHTDFAHFVDIAGCSNRLIIAYWDSPAQFERWRSSPAVSEWWNSDERLQDGVGYFREILRPRMEQFETAFSSPHHLEGVGRIMGGVSGEIREHLYWGSMRDRIPLSQTDAMSPVGELSARKVKSSLGRVLVSGHQNLAVIRSGQDWADTAGEERRIYVDVIEPTLRAGMEFLQDRGSEVGCYSNRYVRITDAEDRPMNKSFGISHWRSLTDLEQWAELHPTHLSIFMTFLELAPKVQSLRLYHEVSVFDAAAQHYEYINCHPRTGLMRAA